MRSCTVHTVDHDTPRVKFIIYIHYGIIKIHFHGLLVSFLHQNERVPNTGKQLLKRRVLITVILIDNVIFRSSGSNLQFSEFDSLKPKIANSKLREVMVKCRLF